MDCRKIIIRDHLNAKIKYHEMISVRHGPLDRYMKLRVAHAPGMPITFSPTLRLSDSNMHHGTCVTHVPWCMTGSLTSGFLWSWWRGNRSRHSRRVRNPKFYVSGKRPIDLVWKHRFCVWLIVIRSPKIWKKMPLCGWDIAPLLKELCPIYVRASKCQHVGAKYTIAEGTNVT